MHPLTIFGLFVATALVWLWLIDGVRPQMWEMLGAAISVAGMAMIYFAPRTA